MAIRVQVVRFPKIAEPSVWALFAKRDRKGEEGRVVEVVEYGLAFPLLPNHKIPPTRFTDMAIFTKLYAFVLGLIYFGAAASSVGAAGYSVEIDLGQQRAYLLHGGRVVLDSPICSGRAAYPTPTGRFKILDKNIDHRSSLYGKIIDARGRTVVADADSDMPIPRGCRFVNAPMPYFMRFTGGVGMHAGYLPGYPASHGCVRLPKEIASQFYRAVEVGTPVTVFGNARRARIAREQPRAREPEREFEFEERRVRLIPFRRRAWAW